MIALSPTPLTFRGFKLLMYMNFAMKTGFIGLLLLLPIFAGAQTMTTSGNWNDATKWVSGNIGDAVTETVIINNNVNPTIINGTSFTVGNTTLSQGNTFTIQSGGTLNIGNATNANDLSANNNIIINVAGTLIIWGDLVVNNNLEWNITGAGTVIIKGNVQLNANSEIEVTGNLTVEGNWIGNNNNDVTVNSPGSITVNGDINLGNNSDLTGCSGCFHLGGTCTGPSSFCNSGPLPIELMSFTATQCKEAVCLEWSTASEENFDKFIIEHSSDGLHYDSIGSVSGSGNSKVQLNYGYKDQSPTLGKNYYRLRSVDYDLTTEYSEPVLAQFTGEKNVVVYPNPARGTSIQLRTNFNPSEGDMVQIFDNLGLKIFEYKITGIESTLAFDRSLKPGSYLLRYNSNNYSQVIRFTSN
jgi:hypothetical protein